MLTVLYYALGQEAEVIAILLGQPYQRGAQCLGRLLDKRLKIDDVVTRQSPSIATVGIAMISIHAPSSCAKVATVNIAISVVVSNTTPTLYGHTCS